MLKIKDFSEGELHSLKLAHILTGVMYEVYGFNERYFIKEIKDNSFIISNMDEYDYVDNSGIELTCINIKNEEFEVKINVDLYDEEDILEDIIDTVREVFTEAKISLR